MKNVVLIIAHNGFRDEEYVEPKKVFELAGVKVTTASTQLGSATGKLGLKTNVDITIDQLNVTNYDAVLFIGGPGCYDLYENKTCHKLAKDTVIQGKILGAICAAPGILAHAGVLTGKKATMFDDTGVLAKFGATYTGNGVEVDGKIVTATGPDTAKKWAEAILGR